MWNFVGLEDDFPIYQVFLSTRSLYLAVWYVMDSVAGISALKPFVENIVLCAPKSGIIVVGTHLDLLIDELGTAADAKCDEYTRYFHSNVD